MSKTRVYLLLPAFVLAQASILLFPVFAKEAEIKAIAPLVAANAPQPQKGLPMLTLKAGKQTIKAQVAATDETRQTGLMHRSSMPPNEGMVFVFPQLGYHAMWMRNTLIPLSVAYLDDSGKIVSIHEMEALNETSHQAKGPARFALEMNAKWFSKHDVKVGDVIGGLDKAPKPQ
jgi:uncharacterized protein